MFVAIIAEPMLSRTNVDMYQGRGQVHNTVFSVFMQKLNIISFLDGENTSASLPDLSHHLETICTRCKDGEGALVFQVH
jgi:hypothetical protein